MMVLKFFLMTNKFIESKVRIESGKKIKAPIILDATTIIECKVEKLIETGDHYVVIGKAIEAYRIKKGKPILWYRRTPYSLGEKI